MRLIMGRRRWLEHPRTEMLSFRLATAEMERLDAMLAKLGARKSDWIRELVMTAVSAHEKSGTIDVAALYEECRKLVEEGGSPVRKLELV